MITRRAPDWLTQWEYAHRGLHSDGVPENSIAGAVGAMAAGLAIECDIQMSGDGVPMVFHDWDLARLAGADGQFADYTAAQLSAKLLRGSDQNPATLIRFLEEVGGRVPVLVEVKSLPTMQFEPVCTAVSEVLSAYSGDFAVMSFDDRITKWFRENTTIMPCGLVMREDEFGYTQSADERRAAFDNAQPDFLAYHIAALPSDWVADLRSSGLPILSWTVDTPETRARALQCADAVIAEAEGFA